MEYIDIRLAIQYSYNEDLLLRFISRFLREYQNYSLKLLQLSKEEVLKEVHKLKGITLNLGAEKLYHSCIKLEETSEYDEYLKEFIVIFNKSYKELLYL